VNGLILVNKAKGITSRNLVNKIGKILGVKKIGHAGTLDPLASGLMLVCVGEATKLVELLTNHTKEYMVKVKLGVTNNTLDLEEELIYVEDYKIDVDKLREILNSFIGEYNQEVPIYSSVKVDGMKLYDYARNNIEVELPKRKVTITDIELLGCNGNEFSFMVNVSKGTYIRSLVRDIASKLGTKGVMTGLVRTKVDNYLLQASNTLKDIEDGHYTLISIKEILKDMDQIVLKEDLYNKVKHGSIIDNEFDLEEVLLIYNDIPIGIYKRYDKDKTKLKPSKMFNLT
jgi:tRNA pseudouridine55 synthase